LSPPPQKVCKLKLARSSYCCRPVLGILETVPPDSEKMTVAVTSFRHSGAGTVISAFLKNCRRVASGSLSGPTTARQFGSRPSRRLLLSLLESLSATSKFGHTFGDDLCGFHRGLTQLRILDDLTLDPQILLLQMIAQGVEFVDQPIYLPEARARNLSKERIGAVRSDLVATFRLLLGLGFRVDASRFAAVPFRLQGTH
jgi:hypothetical protein